ncbi:MULTISPECIES: phosphate/phosphite/phosphonate ABC transporter substrate-binding protein [unclassified Janthinobacterium]|uniref:phosphate/phosphite/phosphonate ABC transporter substrate-binding protein n=1 Tax=unclassified Janthinobacterium TaxID=2610881 RepID=UPI001615A1A7|nr:MULTISPECIES: PhnD/SsuA/transferrin family substrate-binding protein [unclassified Janthinobacterium]MBB5609370.1 ABC-type phosphate/phosphonate transport system substrate-binding protein [Janthinobacterium sp. S3T4]MBB5614543.1 ABC-type phosphate/phosphonate transport system substrate-binding protein [Janthinobacterium sp. S3M3]
MNWKVALPMYNVSPSVREAYEALLDAVIDALRSGGWRGQVELVRDPALPDLWKQPDLLFGQTCGYPYMTQLQGQVQLIATPSYAMPGCHGSDYSSAIVVRSNGAIRGLEDARGLTAAANDRHSNSGMNVLRHAVAPLAVDGRYFDEVIWSGSHYASLGLVREGAADIAAVDCVTFAYLQQENPAWLEGLSVLQYSASSPGLPMIAGQQVPAELLAQLRTILLQPDLVLAQLMRALHIRAFEHRPHLDYCRILELECEAQAVAYPTLR